MPAAPPSSWRELCRFDDMVIARAVATSIASMEFEVRMLSGPEADTAAGAGARPPHVVTVRPDDWDELADVLGEIIDEQISFDELLLHAHEHGDLVKRRFLLLLIAVVGMLAAVGAIEL